MTSEYQKIDRLIAEMYAAEETSRNLRYELRAMFYALMLENRKLKEQQKEKHAKSNKR